MTRDFDAALDVIEMIGWALAALPAPQEAVRAEIRVEVLQLAEDPLDRNDRHPPWRTRQTIND
jgi:hypothetical protein